MLFFSVKINSKKVGTRLRNIFGGVPGSNRSSSIRSLAEESVRHVIVLEIDSKY